MPVPQRRGWLVHRAVAFSFHGVPPTPLHVVNHIDGDRQNNRISNLEYVTQGDNIRKACNKLQTVKDKARRRGKDVLGRPSSSSAWQRFISINQAAMALGISRSSISMCCWGKLASSSGWEFKFVQDIVFSWRSA